MHRKKFDDRAVEMIPVRLIISVAVLAAIMGMLGIGYQIFSRTAAEHQVENDLRALESELYTMVGSGIARDADEVGAAEGTKRVHTFTLPASLLYLAFGVDPDPENDGRLKTGLTNNGAVIVYRVSGGSKQVRWLPEKTFAFREGEFTDNTWGIHGDGQGFILSKGGGTTFTFELVEKNHVVYILIHATDQIEP